MARMAVYQATVTDEAGSIKPGSAVTVRSYVTGQPLAVLFVDRDGVTAMDNPLVTDVNGFFRFYVVGGPYKITITKDDEEQVLEHVAVGTYAEEDVSGNEPELVTTSTYAIPARTGAVAISRDNPANTALALPSVVDQDGKPLHIVDWSTNLSDVTPHEIPMTPAAGQNIMKMADGTPYTLFSSASARASITLIPSVELDGWYVAP